ncbi:MAG TPA: hypothetical protein VF070_09225 [Streptosporangiaceae bacterium]
MSLMSCSHGRQSTPSSAPEVNAPGGLFTIGELARRTGVTAEQKALMATRASRSGDWRQLMQRKLA